MRSIWMHFKVFPKMWHACFCVRDGARAWHEPEYFSAHPVLTEAAARQIVEAGIHLLGVDFPSVDRPPYPRM